MSAVVAQPAHEIVWIHDEPECIVIDDDEATQPIQGAEPAEDTQPFAPSPDLFAHMEVDEEIIVVMSQPPSPPTVPELPLPWPPVPASLTAHDVPLPYSPAAMPHPPQVFTPVYETPLPSPVPEVDEGELEEYIAHVSEAYDEIVEAMRDGFATKFPAVLTYYGCPKLPLAAFSSAESLQDVKRNWVTLCNRHATKMRYSEDGYGRKLVFYPDFDFEAPLQFLVFLLCLEVRFHHVDRFLEVKYAPDIVVMRVELLASD